MPPTKMTLQQATDSSYSELLAQRRWIKDEQGKVHRTKALSLPELYRNLAYLDDMAPTLFQVSDHHLAQVNWWAAAQSKRATEWMRSSPLYTALAARVLHHLTGLPRPSFGPLLDRSPKHVLISEGSFFAGDVEELAFFQHLLGEHLQHEHHDHEEHPHA